MTSLRTRVAAAALAGSALVGAAAITAEPAVAQDTSSSRMQDRLDRMVENEDITPERAAEIQARIAERAARFEARAAQKMEQTQALADALNTTVDELKEARQAGQSLADIAAANGASLDGVTDLLTERANDRIDAAVEADRIDEAKAAEMRDQIADRVEAALNGERPERSERSGRGHGRRGR